MSCNVRWWLADQSRRNKLLVGSYWPAYGLHHTNNAVQHCPMHCCCCCCCLFVCLFVCFLLFLVWVMIHQFSDVGPQRGTAFDVSLMLALYVLTSNADGQNSGTERCPGGLSNGE